MTERKVSFEDVAREFIRENECDLKDQLLLSCFVEKAKRIGREQQQKALAEFREKGLRRVK